ncbi:uncharacterized protein PHACADRAFT_248655 [Phanerochaete carnosa HHB-10118-sp]|uniref:Uncharacterized protein n=1 Tax=Phanerochaete carnosa (strain HHB-10118-sp) TaxID=650164 RepID=K5WRC8_PHACS|nr:uncharacterized protein PHACADRAFT_248655 [Phanerochaete carnosa HHB-10118-sp]EKM61789.1 hypothetical protein PHACADRAFT_248655 [Phanerochaete carnosa HHB-10118-sp]
MTKPTAPTSNLPPLARLSRYSTDDIEQAIQNLQAIYSPRTLPTLPGPTKVFPKHLIHDASVPDSGYASAEEDSDLSGAASEDGDTFDLDALREDPFERDFTVRWLTTFVARSDTWTYALPDEEDARTALVDAAASLLASFTGAEDDEEDAPDAGLTRTFSFPSPAGTVHVKLNDAPLSSTDHTSVGLQSWGSAIVFAERMCAAPALFGLCPRTLRVLELGAGTGLLGLAAAKLCPDAEVVATDYHPSVLANLRVNIVTNFPPTSPSSAVAARVDVHALDWQDPRYDEPLDAPFDVVLAADVIYHPDHARWIKGCVERLLRENGVFWLIIPLRSTGRHEGMGNTVEAVFQSSTTVQGKGLVIFSKESIAKHGGIGRADESGYTLFRIGWAA